MKTPESLAVTRIRTWVVSATTRSTNHYTITAEQADVPARCTQKVVNTLHCQLLTLGQNIFIVFYFVYILQYISGHPVIHWKIVDFCFLRLIAFVSWHLELRKK